MPALSFRTVLQSGLAVFGTLFLILIGFELYKASQTVPGAVSIKEKATGSDASRAETSPIAASSEARVHTPSTSGQAEGVENAGQQANTVTKPSAETKQDASQRAGEASRSPTANKSKASTSTIKDKQAENNVQGEAPGSKQTAAPAAKPGDGEKQQGSSPQPEVKQHKVKKGETLFQLSRLYYGHNSGVKKIAGFNGISAEAQLMEGQIVKIPLSR
ncbi:LysM peptidoglycan-binding domain-containing protein [Brevibacillus borstelensis]|uniref:LysM peptidoglycan-binding domain-containing protein n=1 Tax=Brevibacillus borstelensis TaxID=45462 RepID=UPI0030C14260